MKKKTPSQLMEEKYAYLYFRLFGQHLFLNDKFSIFKKFSSQRKYYNLYLFAVYMWLETLVDILTMEMSTCPRLSGLRTTMIRSIPTLQESGAQLDYQHFWTQVSQVYALCTSSLLIHLMMSRIPSIYCIQYNLNAS